MLDYIFIIGTSGIGKSTLAQGLFRSLHSTYIEQHMVPEFESRDGTEPMTGELEELTCWENTAAMAQCFHRLGYKNVIISDIDDLRTADIPIVFKGSRFLTLKLVCSDPQQLRAQMKNRPEGGLIDYELQEKINKKMLARPALINERTLDTAGLNAEQVLQRSIEIIRTFDPVIEYEYTKPPKELFYSWVFSNGLR